MSDLELRGAIGDQPMSDSSIPYPNSNLYIAAGTVLPAIATIVTYLRFIVRVKKNHGLGLDDWFVIPSLAGLWAMSICIILGWSNKVYGFASPPSPHPDDPLYQVEGLLPGQVYLQRVEYVFYIFMILTFGFVKLAVIYFYRRVFVVGSSKFGKVTAAGIVITVLWMVAFFFLQVFGCGAAVTPYFGPLGEQVKSCLDGLKYLISLACTDLATDLFIFFMPIPLVWSLHLPPRKKLAVTLVLCLGAVSIAASGIRLAIHAGQVVAGYARKVDLFPTIALPLYFSQIEAGIAVIAINLPILQTTINGRSVTSVIGSIRSVISLSSLHSRDSKRSGRRNELDQTDAQTAKFNTETGAARQSRFINKENHGDIAESATSDDFT